MTYSANSDSLFCAACGRPARRSDPSLARGQFWGKFELGWMRMPLLFALCSSTFSAQTKSPNLYSGTTLQITNWLAVGLAHDDDRRSPASESSHGFVELRKPVALEKKSMVDFYARLGLSRPAKGERGFTFYAKAEIEATEACKAYMLIGSDGMATAWVNGHLVFEARSVRDPERGAYSACVSVVLERGKNLLVIKADNVASVRGDESCGVTVALAPDLTAAASQLVASGSLPFSVSVALPGSKVAFNSFPLELPAAATVRIVDEEGNEIIPALPVTTDGARLPETLKDGFYRLELSALGRIFKTELLVGEVGQWIELLKHRISSLALDEQSKINVDALLLRAELLWEQRNRYPESWQWNRKVLFALRGLHHALDSIERKKTPWASKPGMHLRGFRSDIDGLVRHYRVFIPSTYQPGAHLPLMVILAPSVVGKRPFITSPFIANHIEAEQIAGIAESLGVAVLWPGYPGLPSGNAIEYTHFTEVLSAVAADYDLDPQCIALLGICRAGEFAVKYAQHWPGAFAAVGLLDPITPAAGGRAQFPEFGPALTRWQKSNDPLANFGRAGDTSFAIAFDEGDPGHGSSAEADRYATAARDAGISVERLWPNLTVSHLEAWRALFVWAKSKTSPNAEPIGRRLSGHENTCVGPVLNALAEPFVLVTGTRGGTGEIVALNKWADEFVRQWTATYYGPCRRITDKDVTPEILASYNLILVGNGECNVVWNQLPGIGINISEATVKIDGHEYAAAGPLVAVVRSPYHRDRRIVLVGAARVENLPLLPAHLSVEGYYDYAVWPSEHAGEVLRPMAVEDYSSDAGRSGMSISR
jgi:hypothetical protein